MKREMLCTVVLALVATSVSAADFDIRDEAEFRKIVPETSKVEKLEGGFRFTEGPVWIREGEGHLIFSDIPANELKKWSPAGVTTFRNPSQNANGNTVDLEGRLISAEHSGRRVSRTLADGKVETVVDQFEGKKFNSPNDVVVKSDGTFWFTDPDYGLGQNKREIEGNWVYRVDPKTKKATAVIKDFDKPNGLCFSPDESKLYVADSGRPRHIRVFEVKGETVSEGKVFCTIDKGGPDGIRADAAGRVYSSAGDGVHIFSTDGKLIGKILVPEAPANLCFGGKDFKTLYITARTGLYKIDLAAEGHRNKP
ncbi:MAG TPA: SMP-30/gluconolactonase/LRE family protein [Verrucomicrobiae bacterium]